MRINNTLPQELIEILKKKGREFKLSIKECSKCNSALEYRITTELSPSEERKGIKPKALIVYGFCDKCKIVHISNIIETKNIPEVNF